MKKIIVSLVMCTSLAFAANAQVPEASTIQSTPKKQFSKEEKLAFKEKKKAEEMEALNAVGLDDKQKANSLELLQTIQSQKMKIRKDETLNDDQKKEQIKSMEKDWHERLKQVMGEEKYKKFRETQKLQKEKLRAEMPKKEMNDKENN